MSYLKSESDEKPIPSPCISVCALNDDDICQGCYRSGEEIRDWMILTNAQKRKVIQKALEREKLVNPFL